ncbi:hypothetical protein BJ170DRAFT_682707 [Xylariales sp. AK1849]|nr:hypothetical protein BJ170DRAFT_682707 [Xylariales sp. AK1849]
MEECWKADPPPSVTSHSAGNNCLKVGLGGINTLAAQAAPVAKTSSLKKRKISAEDNDQDTPLQSCETEPDSNPSFSFTSAALAPSPNASPASSLPPRLQQTGATASNADDPSSAASSPSGAYADLTIDSDRGGDTPPAAGANRGSSPFIGKPSYHRAIMGGASEFPERASSPLKRRASSMDPDADEDVDMVPAPTGAPMAIMGHSQPDSTLEQSEGNVTSASNETDQGHLHDRIPSITMTQAPQPPTSIEAHVKSIRALCMEFESRSLVESDQVYVVSKKWVESVIGDARDPKKSAVPDPAAIGPVDNSDIIWEVIEDPCVGQTADPLKRNFVRLKPGTGTEHFNLFPPAAWELVMQWPGLTAGQLPILRMAHKTSESAFDPNVELEMHPPVFTIHRLWSANSPIPIKQIIKSTQPPPIQLARSRTTMYKTFLAQAKSKADVDLKDKVRVWRVPRKLPTIGASAGAAPTPPASPQTHDPNNPQDSWTHLLLDVESFLALKPGVDREKVDFRDVTTDSNYNGHVDLGKLGLSTDQTVVLDEQVEGTDYVSTFSAAKASDKTSAVRSSSASLAVSQNTRSRRTSPVFSGPVTRGRAQKSGRTIGCTGLGNLGNTCYMNAALQCVRGVEELTKYFLSGQWEDEVNPDNVLAHNGDVANAYANLLKEIYREAAPGSVTPRQFKNTIGRYAPAFSGYGQQDSQEFLGFLLDGLQEDLSRIKKKPYIEKPDSTDEMIDNPAAIAEMADKVWDITKKRDDSVIADLFTGLYKSTLVCPDPKCAKVSITFDPFNNLTLPLPVENKWSHTVKFFPLNDRPVDIRVELDKSSSMKKLKEFVSSRTGVPVERLHGAEEWKGKFYKQYSNGACASEEIAHNDNAWIYEVEAAPSNWNSAESKKLENATAKSRRSLIDEAESPDPEVYDALLVPVIHRRPASNNNRYSQRSTFALAPHFIIVNPNEARSEDVIRRKILQKVATFSSHKAFQREDSDSSDSTEFVTNGSDSSSNEGKVTAQSIQGEDNDIVDVTMQDAGDSNGVSQATQSKQSSGNYVYHKTAPSWVDPEEHLPAQFQNMFELCYFSEQGSLLASGMHALAEDKEYPRLSSRAPESSGSDDANDSIANGSASNEETSSDEVSHRGTEEIVTRMMDESEEEDSATVVKIAHRPKAVKHDTKAMGGRKKPKPVKYGKKGSKRAQRQAAKANRKQQLQQHQQQQQGYPESQSPSQTDDSGADSDALIRLREGIVVDWIGDDYDALFGDSIAVWEQCDTLDDPELDKTQQVRAKRKKHGISLYNCLDEFEREEVLSEQDTWYCPRCKTHQRAAKKFDLWKTPDILVVHLKRFSSSGWRRDKLDVLVDFPIEGLDLTKRVLHKEDGKDELYDLIGVDCHWGGLGGGHYTAHAKNFVDNQWYSYNDSSVSRTSADRIVDSSAYLLFYRRRSESPLGGPRLKEIVESYDNPASDDDTAKAGEGPRLDEGSSPTGSSSAFREQGAGATHLGQAGTHGGRILGSALPRPGSDDGLTQLSDARFDSAHTVHRSIEDDEGIDMAENPTHSTAAFPQTWDFTMLTAQTMGSGGDRVPGSPLASGAATDEAQQDSSSEDGLAPTFDHDTDMIPGVDRYELGPASEGNLPSYTEPSEPPPPDYRAEISRDDMSSFWDAKQAVHNVPAGGEDQRSEAAAEIILDDEETQIKQE